MTTPTNNERGSVFFDVLPVRDILKIAGLIFLFGMVWARSEAHILQLRENTNDIRHVIMQLNAKLESAQGELTKIRYELVETRTELKYVKETFKERRKE